MMIGTELRTCTSRGTQIDHLSPSGTSLAPARRRAAGPWQLAASRRIVALLGTLASCGPGAPSDATDAGATTSPGATTPAPTPTSSSADASTTDDTATGDPATCPDDPGTDACCCFEQLVDPMLGPTGTQSACPTQLLCPGFTFYCDDPSNPDLPCPAAPFGGDDVAALACALQALADGKTGEVTWTLGNGMEATSVTLHLVGDGTVFRQGNHRYDLCFDIRAVQHLPLPPSTYFGACLDAPDWQSRFSCLQAAPLGEPFEICIPGGDYSDANNHC